MKNNDSFKQALLDSVSFCYDTVPSEAALKYSYSEDIDGGESKTTQRPNRRLLRTIIAAAVFVSVLICAALAASDSGERPIELTLHIEDERYYFTAEAEDLTELPEVASPHCPDYVPEGYELCFSKLNKSGVTQWFDSQSGDFIVFEQRLLSSVPENEYGFSLYGNGIKVSQRELNDTKVFILTDEKWDDMNIVWATGEYIYYIKLSSELPLSEVEHIVNAVRTCSDVPNITD